MGEDGYGQALGLKQLFASGDGCWSVDGFIRPSDGAAAQGEGVRSLSAPPAPLHGEVQPLSSVLS